MSLADFPDPSSYFSFKWASGYDKYTRAIQNRVKEIISFEVTSQEGIDLARRYLYDAGDGSAHGGILSYSALATGWTFDSNYSGPSETGYTYMLTKLATDGAHAMTIVGYDDTVEFSKDGQIHKGAFIVVNSYGTWWGDDGRYYLPYYFFLQDRPSQTLSHDVTGCSCTVHSPQVVFRVKVTYDSRNDLAFTMGVADKPYATTPTVTLKSAIAANQGGDHPMQGEYSDDNSIELAFDFTEAVPKYASYTEPKYFLTVTRSEIGKAGSGVINAFSVIDYRPTARRSMSATFRSQSCWKRARISSRPPRPPSKPPRRRPYNGSTTSGPPTRRLTCYVPQAASTPSSKSRTTTGVRAG